MSTYKLFKKYYPDDSMNGTVRFYSWIRSGIKSTDVLLNVGAGLTSADKIRSLRGEVQKVIGLDIDPDVISNQDLDEAHLISDTFPILDNSIDIAWSDYVLEHIERPHVFLSEIYRVLKPGGCYYFRTPNIFNYVSVISRFTPHFVHSLLANRARGMSAKDHEPYKTYYRLNSARSLRKAALCAGFSEIDLRYVECEPSYLMFNPIAFYLGVAYERVVNSSDMLSFMRANIFGRFKK